MAATENTLILETTQGPVTIEMRPDLAPGHVARIKELVREGFYDGIVFHRVIEVTRAWAPKGADRFYNLVKNGFYDNARFFRVISGFMVQFGIHGDPGIMARWRTAQIFDDPVAQSNTKGMVTFAMAGPNTRTSQVFINFGDNSRLDQSGFSPFGRVLSGMNVVEAINAEYGEGAPNGRGPNQSRIQSEGNTYLSKDFPRMDFIKKATIER